MAQVLRYGERQEIEFNVPDDRLLANWTDARGEPLDDLVAAVSAAVSDPLEFPPLAQATAPGDRIAIAVGESVPQADAVVAGVVHELLEGYAEANDIAIVHPAGMRPPVEMLSDEEREAITIVAHRPDDREELAYLAAADDGEPIYFNRTMADADIVVPIGAFRAAETLTYYGVHGCLFPTFADEETQRRFRVYENNSDESKRRSRQAEAEQAAWVLGILFTVQVIPGRHNGILNVLSGHSVAVEREGEELVAAAWGFETSQRARLVVASVEGGAEEQTWENFARALHAARRVADDDAAIVLCTELAQPPGIALQQLQGWDMAGGEDEQDLNTCSEPDGISAALLASLADHATVFLLSRLDEDLVEALGMGYVQDSDAVQRLISQFENCILLGAAQRTAPVATY
jgi:nickel-dependent lactate racemase